jgi:hypothetical protein
MNNNSKILRKLPGKVTSIDGKQVTVDVISQKELSAGAELQITAWRIERECQEYMKLLATRFSHGATVEAGDLQWDSENEMVRSRKAREA